jgi:formylglycine-generating enzyme required for sulfatase activity
MHSLIMKIWRAGQVICPWIFEMNSVHKIIEKEEPIGVEDRLKVFISYSRKDDDFAQELLAGLQLAGFEPYLDKHDIAAGEDWEMRLSRLIETADAVVFVVSPDAVASQRCAWEIQRAESLNKRLLPIVWRSVEEAKVPPGLKRLNYIFFDRPHFFGPSMLALAAALKIDNTWIREHTRIDEAALRWQARGRAEALLWRGEELAATKIWLTAQPKFAPEPTLLMHEFIKAGEDAEAAHMNSERQLLDKMAAAQNDREKALEHERAALKEREKALQRERDALRKGQRARAAIRMLLVCIIGGLVGWINQDIVREQLKWYTIMRPYMLANFRNHVLTPDVERKLQPKNSFRECGKNCPEMIVVPAGHFNMGSLSSQTSEDPSEEPPPHRVVFPRSFAISKFEITFDDWDACATYGDCRTDVSDSGWGRGTQPVVNVSWDDAKTYAKWLSRMTGRPYRLLSEAEWEYAARAGTQTVYAWGDTIGNGNANCNGCGSSWDRKRPASVGSFASNLFGLHDMHGNVWEWVEDCLHLNYTGAPEDGAAWSATGNCAYHIVRGGSWNDYPIRLRSAYRGWNTAVSQYDRLGFRVGRTITP